MTWSVFHSESEKLAIEAQLAAQIRNHDLARELYRRAAEAERRALALVGTGKARTRAITAVSAVALSFKAREFPAAEQLAHEMLADASLPEFARADLRNLVQAIWTEAAKQSAGVSFLPGQVTVSVKGGEVVTGGAPLDLIYNNENINLNATRANQVDIARLLIERGADVNAKDDQQDSPFLYAAAEGRLQILRLTLAAGADLASTNRYGGTALIPAAHHGHVETVRELLQTKIAIDHVNRLGWTALLEAIILGDGGAAHTEIVRLLDEKGRRYFAERKLKQPADFSDLSDIEFADRRSIFDAVARMDSYDLAKVLHGLEAGQARDKLLGALSERRRQDVEQELQDVGDIDPVEARQIGNQLVNHVKAAMMQQAA